MRAGFQHIGMIGDLERGLRILLHQQDGAAFRLERADDGEDLFDEQRREAHGGLAEAAASGQRRLSARADRQHLLLTAWRVSPASCWQMLAVSREKRVRKASPAAAPAQISACTGTR